MAIRSNKLFPVAKFLADLEVSVRNIKHPKIRKEAVVLLKKANKSYERFKKENNGVR